MFINVLVNIYLFALSNYNFVWNNVYVILIEKMLYKKPCTAYKLHNAKVISENKNKTKNKKIIKTNIL